VRMSLGKGREMDLTIRSLYEVNHGRFCWMGSIVAWEAPEERSQALLHHTATTEVGVGGCWPSVPPPISLSLLSVA
jgi:hypothetical protein